RKLEKKKKNITTTTQIISVSTMSSIGVFLEEEIDGKPFHIYNFLSQTSSSSSGEAANIDSGGDNDNCHVESVVERLTTIVAPTLATSVMTITLFIQDALCVEICGMGKSLREYLNYVKHAFSQSRKDHCDFILHEACASSPLKKHHPLHAHSLTLEIVANGFNNTKGLFFCNACRRYSCGFDYEDFVGSFFGFRLDLRCASVSEPFEYQGHEHPLFLALSPEEEEMSICQICQEDGDGDNQCKKLNCIECDYIICFRCATLPYKASYKHDKHFLTFTKVKDANDHESGWCEVCERTIVYSQKGGFYACDDEGCCTTVHVHCLLGKDPYMKPGQTITVIQGDALVLRNNTMTRPFCHNHGVRCQGKVVFQYSENIKLCSMS
ncbi:unnamed protein product, partial [Thlaspi arvense]